MGRGVANTGTVKLSEVMNAFAYGSAVRTDTYTTPGTGTSTAPSNATWAKIELWGAGGGGSGYALLGRTEGGGGGGGYCSYIAPVVGGSTIINYTVGAGGAAVTGNVSGITGGASNANNWNSTTEIRSIQAFGGVGAGTDGVGNGGVGSSPALGTHIENSSSTDGSPNSGTTGGAGANGGAGGAAGVAGTAPGGGGGAATSAATPSGAGANGKVVITWYGPSTANNLRSYLRGGSYVPQGAVGYNGSIPASGTLKIRDFVGVDKIGYIGNTIPAGYSNVYVYHDAYNDAGGSASANATIILKDDGVQVTNNWSYDHQTWMQRIVSNCDSTICGNYDVQFIKTVGSTPSGNTVNTWHQMNTNVQWSITASRTGNGVTANSARGFLTFRRRSDNTVLVNVAMNLHAYALVSTDPCPTCCFTPDTPITMADYSTKPIGEVRVGDIILSRTGAKTVSEIIVREKREMHVIRFADGRILNASEDHPLYVKGKGYASVRPTVEYKDLGVPELLEEGDFVVDQNGNENEIVSITDLYYPHEVYTFAETEFYANGMLVY